MTTKKALQDIFNNSTVNQNRVDRVLALIKKEQIAFAEYYLTYIDAGDEYDLPIDKLLEKYNVAKQTESCP